MRVGLVGCGAVGVGQHLRAYRELPEVFDVVAVADPSAERLEIGRAAAGLLASAATLDPGALLVRDDVDLVDVCTPPAFRAAVAVEAARNGKHVLCEKPIAVQVEDAWAIVAAVRDAGVIGAMVHNFLFLPEIQRAATLIRDGRVGPPELVSLDWLGIEDLPGVGGAESAWRHAAAVAGGGVLIDMIHAVYVTETLLGQPFTRASAYLRQMPETEVEAMASCRFESRDALALVNVAWGRGPASLTISGRTGWIRLSQPTSGVHDFDRLERIEAGDGGTTVLREFIRAPRAYERSFELVMLDLARGIREGVPVTASILDGAHTLEAARAAYRSAATRRVEEIGDGDAAQRH